MSALPFIGRCKGCDFVLFTDVADVKSVRDLRAVHAGTACRTVGSQGVVGRCYSGHRVFPMRQIDGTYSEAHACDARCMNARGHTCTCSCGGVNHGRGHAARALPALNPDAGPLGVVGRSIVGDVAVVGRRTTQSGLVAFTLLAVSNGAEIRWYIDPDRAPAWKVSDRFKLRARVKRHDDRATIVTYAEVAGEIA